ncbi:Hypothetical protein, putative [Bodo saltans]|uniref:Uncharacterized protein n=1 Tax=Bodo saltans TaxID=75058 RepID=A0A0S4JPV8_BODSA|nr:Hypothetical protein, putative [Bodo saltans]|eukprot:CUG92356.1 Hypothetical protein, putative [Bodo saltans]
MGVCASAPDEEQTTTATTPQPSSNEVYATTTVTILKPLRFSNASPAALTSSSAPKPQIIRTTPLTRDNNNATWMEDSVSLQNSNRNNSNEIAGADAPTATTSASHSDNYHRGLEQCTSPASLGALMPLPHVPPTLHSSASKEVPPDTEVELRVLTMRVPDLRRADAQSPQGQRRSLGDVKDSDASLTMCFDQELHSPATVEPPTVGAVRTPTIAAIAPQNQPNHHRANHHVVQVKGDQVVTRRLTLMGSATPSTSTLQPQWDDSGADDVQNPLALPKLGGAGGRNDRSKRNSMPTGVSTSSGASLQGFMQMRDPSNDSFVDADATALHPGSLTSVLTPKSGLVAPGAAWRPTMNAAGFSMDSFAFMQSNNNAVSTSMASSRGFGSSAPLLIQNGEDLEWHLPKFRRN